MRAITPVATVIRSLVVIATLACATPAQAETVNCTPIAAVPVVITLPGVYCFTKSFVTSATAGNIIDIQANNVVLDMNGHRLGGLAAGLGTATIGIYAIDRQNITIKNGTIRGFAFAIRFLQSSAASLGHVIEDVRADQNTYMGIYVNGSGTIVRNCQVAATGGTTLYGLSSYGIFVNGNGARVLNNDVDVVASAGSLLGYGIYMSTAGGLAVDNRITSADYGIYYSGTGKYSGNLTFDTTVPFTGGTAVGVNN